MKKSLIIASAALLSLNATVFAAAINSLPKDQVTPIVQDKTITTDGLVTINDQLVPNKLHVFLDKNGTATGQLDTKPADTVQNDTGTYTVKANGSLCVTWQQWNKSQPICVYLYSVDNAYIFINADNNKFESLALKTDIKSGNQMSSMPGSTNMMNGTPVTNGTTTPDTTTPTDTSTSTTSDM